MLNTNLEMNVSIKCAELLFLCGELPNYLKRTKTPYRTTHSMWQKRLYQYMEECRQKYYKTKTTSDLTLGNAELITVAACNSVVEEQLEALDIFFGIAITSLRSCKTERPNRDTLLSIVQHDVTNHTTNLMSTYVHSRLSI